MRRALLLSSLLFLQCKQSSSYPPPEAAEKGINLINSSIEVHGGWDAYKSLDTIAIVKTINLFDPQGNLESQSKERQSFIFKPSYSTTIVRTSDSMYYNGQNLIKIIGDSLLFEPEKRHQEVSRIKAAEFVFFQPFKLRDSSAMVLYNGKVKLLDLVDVSEVKINYPNSEDTWWFYFDKANRCLANKVLHNGRYSLIQNIEFQEYKGLLFNKHRKSYFVDSLGAKKQLRAEYFYDFLD